MIKIIGDKSNTPPSGGINLLNGSNNGSYILPKNSPNADSLRAGSHDDNI